MNRYEIIEQAQKDMAMLWQCQHRLVRLSDYSQPLFRTRRHDA